MQSYLEIFPNREEHWYPNTWHMYFWTIDTIDTICTHLTGIKGPFQIFHGHLYSRKACPSFYTQLIWLFTLLALATRDRVSVLAVMSHSITCLQFAPSTRLLWPTNEGESHIFTPFVLPYYYKVSHTILYALYKHCMNILTAQTGMGRLLCGWTLNQETVEF